MENRSTFAPERAVPPLVFIPGIKGSTLADAHGNRIWLTPQQALGLATPPLSLPLQWDGDAQRSDGVVADGPLRSIASVNIYAPFLDWAQTSGRSFHPFPYDWRRDNLETADRFLLFLEAVSDRHHGAKVQIVAHSMGGLISFIALNRRPDLFHSLLFAGVPFGPSMSLFEDLHAGIANGLNKQILNPQVMFTFASPYFIFPMRPTASRLFDENGDEIGLDWYNAEDWERQKLGIYADGAERIADEQRQHLRNALRRAKDLRLQLTCRHVDSFQYPPIAVLASDKRPTLSSVVRNGPHAVRGWDFQSATKQMGDGRVAFTEAMPPAVVPRVVHKSSRQHASILNDTQQIDSILVELCVD